MPATFLPPSITSLGQRRSQAMPVTGDGFGGGEAEGQREQRRGREHDRAVDAGAGSECQEWPWRPWPAVCSSATTTEPTGSAAAACMVESTEG